MQTKRQIINSICVMTALVLLQLPTHAAVTATQGLGSFWIGSPAIVTTNLPSLATTAETSYGGTSSGTASGAISLGQSFTIPGEVTNTYILTNIQMYVSGSASTYVIYLYDLGTNNTGATSPAWYTNVTSIYTVTSSNLFSPNLSFSYSGGSQSVMQLDFSAADAVTVVGRHKYVFEIAPTTSTVLSWYRSGSAFAYDGGCAYRSEGVLNGIQRELAMAVTLIGVTNSSVITNYPAPPMNNFSINVVTAPLASTWPGPPLIQTYSDPTLPNTGDGSRVAEGFDSPQGRVLSMSFVPTNDFNLGSVTIRGTGGGSTGAVFMVSLYKITSNAGGAGYPFNYRPQFEAVNLLTNNPCFRFAGSLNDEFITLNFTNLADQVPLIAGTNYAFEIVRDTNSAYNGTLFWIRGNAAVSTYGADFPVVPRGYAVGSGNGNLYWYGDGRNLRTPLSSGIRDYVMAISAAPLSITIATVSRSANNVSLTWNASASATYTVWRKVNLTDASWTSLQTGITIGSYTDTAATAGTGFYRVSSP